MAASRLSRAGRSVERLAESAREAETLQLATERHSLMAELRLLTAELLLLMAELLLSTVGMIKTGLLEVDSPMVGL